MKNHWRPIASRIGDNMIADDPVAEEEALPFRAAVRKELQIIVPVHNEVGALESFDRELREALIRAGMQASILYVDDGSTDGSGECLQEKGAEVLPIGANRGYGAAIKMGMRATDSVWVAIIDADSTYDPEDLVRLWSLRDTCEMAVGQRPPEKGMRRVAKAILHAVGSYAVDFPIPDINSGIRIFRREVAEKLIGILPNGFSLTSTITLGALYVPYRVRYLPVAYRKREGKSKIKPAKALANFTLLILRTMVLWAPLKFFMPPSLLFAAIGMIFLARDLWAGNIAQTSILMLVNAFILFSLGMLAEAIRSRD
jgi:glycosyltransferase involved in cell wall biosynthesis